MIFVFTSFSPYVYRYSIYIYTYILFLWNPLEGKGGKHNKMTEIRCLQRKLSFVKYIMPKKSGPHLYSYLLLKWVKTSWTDSTHTMLR